MNEVIHIDGSLGEGGGQVLRTSLALSMITGKRVEFKNIRAGRAKPGLMRQHLACVRAAQKVCGAGVKGDELKSLQLSFQPGKIKSGDYHFSVGSAGSASLVLQTVLPALMLAEGFSSLELEGGTHNPMAPPFDFLEKAFLPQLKKMGVEVDVDLLTWGFFPAGGGHMKVKIYPVEKLKSLSLMERGELISRKAEAWVSSILLSIAESEVKVLSEKLEWDEIFAKKVNEPKGPGNIIMALQEYENVTEFTSSFGERGLKAARVADRLVREVRKYQLSEAPVGEYLADQLLLPMALSGKGEFLCTELSSHSRTNMEVIQKFIDVSFSVEERASGVYIAIS